MMLTRLLALLASYLIPITHNLKIHRSQCTKEKKIWREITPRNIRLVERPTVRDLCSSVLNKNFKSPKDETNLYNAVCVGNHKFKSQMGDGYEKGIKQCRGTVRSMKVRSKEIKFKVISYCRKEYKWFIIKQQTGTKQSAFYYALTRVSIAHNINEACVRNTTCCISKGNPPRPHPRFPHVYMVANSSVPSTNVKVNWVNLFNTSLGIQHTRRTLKIDRGSRFCREKRLSKVDKLNILNANIGLKVYKSKVRHRCKCVNHPGRLHRCGMVECYRTNPPLSYLARTLKRMMMEAQYVSEKKLKWYYKDFKKRGTIRQRRLIFLKNSPDFCAKNARLGLGGMRGREVRHVSMCCGSGGFTRTVTKKDFYCLQRSREKCWFERGACRCETTICN